MQPADEPAAEPAVPRAFLRQCAARWPRRTGGRALQAAAGAEASYAALLRGPLTADDEEQIGLDVERSTVDGLESLMPPWLDEAALRAALGRLLRAWCCKHPDGYCQGMNFVMMVLLVVMQHAEQRDGTAIQGYSYGAEETAFWTFAAVVELLLPSDFYEAPSMPGLQREVRVLFELFELERARAETREGYASVAAAGGGARWGSEECASEHGWRDILRLACYKWFVPCFVNCVPLPTLLLFWDEMLLHAPARAPPGASMLTLQRDGTDAHLLLALALLRAALAETREALDAARPEEGLGLGFNRFVEAATDPTRDAAALLSDARALAPSSAQLHYLRARLDAAPPPAAPAAAPPRGRPRSAPPEPSLSGIEAVALQLMSPPRADGSLALRLLMRTLLLHPSPPPPIEAVARRVSHLYYPRLVSTCALTCTAALVWTGRRALGLALGLRGARLRVGS